MIRMLKESFLDLFRHKLSSTVLVVVIALSIFSLAAISTVLFNLGKLEKRWADDIRIIVFVSDAVQDKNILLNQIDEIKGIKKVEFISAEEAAGILRKHFPDEDILFSSTIIPGFFEITANSAVVDDIVKQLKAIQNVDDVIVNYSWLKSLKEVLSVIKYSAEIGLSFVLVLSLLLLSYSARIDAMQRKREMEIYRLCGATEWYIRFPYIAGGALIGFIGAVIGVLVFILLKTVFQGIVIHFSSVFISSFNYVDMPLTLFMLLLVVGPVIGALGHIFAFFAIKAGDKETA